jgi:hypothetical protein
MKKAFSLMVVLLQALCTNAQLFDFAHTVYYETVDSVPVNGTTLTSSGTTLLSFNYNDNNPSHPLYNNGVYFPINDCAGHNLWLRVKHIAADPNGIENGHAIQQSMNSPFLPAGAADRIGGWNGFLYDFQIFSDVEFSSNRQNIIDGPFPIQLIVESLETLYNDGGQLFEWLSFEIVNPESQGWQLMSTNFTGINPFSTPGFSADLRYATPVISGMAPEGFSTNFPNGSRNIYAIDLNLSASYHSEFRMTADAVSHFRYGYEFTPGGYQGMSMTFGGEPTIIGTVENQCGTEANGSISLISTGPQPFVFDWGNGVTGPTIENLLAGSYTVTLTDGTGCSASATFDLIESIPVYVSLEIIPDSNGVWLIANTDGGSGELEINWSTGEIADSIYVNSNGTYSVTVSSNGCFASASYTFVGINDIGNSNYHLYPNPTEGVCYIESPAGTNYRVFNVAGAIVETGTVSESGRVTINLTSQADGIYHLLFDSKAGNQYQGRLVKMH